MDSISSQQQHQPLIPSPINEEKDMLSRGRKKGSAKKFPCTEYPDCNMVFTRSEHLLRHIRKHTGEKPFQCTIPGCDSRFSRFDNMIQHTQTHNRTWSRLSRRRKRGKHPAKRCSLKSLPTPPYSRRNSSQDSSSLVNNFLQRNDGEEEEEEEEEHDTEEDGEGYSNGTDSDASYSSQEQYPNLTRAELDAVHALVNLSVSME